MMSILRKITEDLTMAIKAKDEIRLSSLRMLKSDLKNRQVEKGQDLTDAEIQSAVSSLIRKGRDAAKEFRKGHREDLAVKEEREIEVYHAYLPQQLESSEIEKILKETISELSAEGSKDLGRVMKTAMARMAGRAQGQEVNEIAKRLLG
ncbi:MAG: GatB/YqeY domain-containing protein [Deltaproteobacteria bacterium]|nr:GatB/YqeY domain-containing protein [Deltaproteobacteria bacterium]